MTPRPFPIAVHICASSACIRNASFNKICLIRSTLSWRFRRQTEHIRSSAQKRFFAVGRVCAIAEAACWTASYSSCDSPGLKTLSGENNTVRGCNPQSGSATDFQCPDGIGEDCKVVCLYEDFVGRKFCLIDKPNFAANPFNTFHQAVVLIRISTSRGMTGIDPGSLDASIRSNRRRQIFRRRRTPLHSRK